FKKVSLSPAESPKREINPVTESSSSTVSCTNSPSFKKEYMPEYVFGETVSFAGPWDWAGQEATQTANRRTNAKKCAHCFISGIRARNFQPGNSTTIKPRYNRNTFVVVGVYDPRCNYPIPQPKAKPCRSACVSD